MRLWGGLVALAVLLVGVASAGAAPAPTAVPVLVIDGRGFGHGVGMAQDGAYWMARAGSTMPQIINHFYPGTTFGKSTGNVRVVVLPGPGQDADLLFPAGGEVRDALQGQQSSGFPVAVHPGETVHVHYENGDYTLEGGTPRPEPPVRAQAQTQAASTDDSSPRLTIAEEPTTTTTSEPSTTSSSTTSTTAEPLPTTVPGTPTTAPPPSSTTTEPPPPSNPPPTTTTTAPAPSTTTTTAKPRGPLTTSTRSLWAVPTGKDGTVTVPGRERTYRGVIEAVANGADLRLLNQVDLETYLKGMGEVRDPSWPQPALRTQAIAARTYAMRAMAAANQICDDQRCQVYLGAEAEYPAMNKAVDATAKQVVLFNKQLASTVYSANGGGFSATPQEGFGTTGDGFPYLTAAPYKSDNPLPWTVKVALTDLGARFGYKGQLSDVKVAEAGPSGRALTMELDGDKGALAVPGLQFARSLGLKSNLVNVHVEAAEAPPPPPPTDVNLIQAPPDEVAQAAALATPALDQMPSAGLLPTFAVPPSVAAVTRLPKRGSHGPGGPITVIVLLLLVYAGISLPWRRSGSHFA